MNTYRAPRPSRRMPDLPFPPSAGPPRPFQEWEALRRRGKLPQAEREIPGFVLRIVREGAGLTTDGANEGKE